MVGLSKGDFANLISRAGTHENRLGNQAPRIGSLEHHIVAVDSLIANLDARLAKFERPKHGRDKPRANVLQDEGEASAPEPMATHRKPGPLPLAAAPVRGLSQGQLVAVSTPPASVTLTAPLADGAAMWFDEGLAPESAPVPPDPSPAPIAIPGTIAKDIFDTMANIDKDMVACQQDRTNHFQSITKVEGMLNKMLEIEDVMPRLVTLEIPLQSSQRPTSFHTSGVVPPRSTYAAQCCSRSFAHPLGILLRKASPSIELRTSSNPRRVTELITNPPTQCQRKRTAMKCQDRSAIVVHGLLDATHGVVAQEVCGRIKHNVMHCNLRSKRLGVLIYAPGRLEPGDQ